MPTSGRDRKSPKANRASESGSISASELSRLIEAGITEVALRKDGIKRLTTPQRAAVLGVPVTRHGGGARFSLSTFSLTPKRPVHGTSYLQLAACQLFDPRYPTLTGTSPTGDAWFDNKSVSSYAFRPSVAVFFHAAKKALVEFHLSLGVNDQLQAAAQFRTSWQVGIVKSAAQAVTLDAIHGGISHVVTAFCDPQDQTGKLPFFAVIEQIDPVAGPQIWWRFHSASITTRSGSRQ